MLTVRPFSFLIFLVFTIVVRGQNIPDSIGQAGVSFSLANYRAARLTDMAGQTDLHYDLVFHLPAEGAVPVTGEEKISFQSHAKERARKK